MIFFKTSKFQDKSSKILDLKIKFWAYFLWRNLL